MSSGTIERLAKIPLTKITTVNIKQKFFDMVQVDRRDATHEHEFSLYIGELAVGNTPILIKSPNKNLELGENELYLQELEHSIPWTPEAIAAFPFNKAYIDKLLTNDFRDHDNPHQKAGECLEKIYKPYGTTVPVGLEDLKDCCSKSDVEFVIDTWIDHGYKIDPKTRTWAKMNLIKFTPRTQNIQLAKVRPHAIIVKSEKAGFSTIAARIMDNENIDAITIKSFEGTADCQGNIAHSPLHNNFGSINIDEVQDIPQGSLQRCFDYMERGELRSYKASRKILNQGAACLNFTSNPETIKKNENEDARPQDYLNAWINNTYSLTSRPSAGYSRIGFFLFDNDLLRATLEHTYSQEDLERIDSIAHSIMELASPKITKIYWDLYDWLNKPIENYNKDLDGIISTAGNSLNLIIKDAIKGQRSAYRHIRGGALALSCVEHMRDILFEEYDIQEIIETAEEKLQILCSYNLKSFKKVLDFSRVLDKPENFINKFSDVKPDYIKSIVLAYAVKGRKEEDEKKILDLELESAFERIPTTMRVQILGERYAYWSRVRQEVVETTVRLEKVREYLQAVFDCKFGYQLDGNNVHFWLENDQKRAESIYQGIVNVFPDMGRYNAV